MIRSKYNHSIFLSLFFWAVLGLILSGAGVKLLFPVLRAEAAPALSGRILLQVEDKGQAWYVNPLDGRRYFLGRPQDAFNLMRSLGLGVSNADLAVFQSGRLPSTLLGRILLQVEDKGQAWYVNPVDKRLYYLGRPQDAFDLMRSQALGITNNDLARWPVYTAQEQGSNPSQILGPRTFNFKYKNQDYYINLDLEQRWYDHYRQAPKVYTYSISAPPPNPREAFYGLFLQAAQGDELIRGLAAQLRNLAAQQDWSSDELAEAALALIQYIPYDHDKLTQNSNRNINPYYPYETLYLNRGVCSDTTFLAVMLMRELGYGAAILDFPDSNHSALGLACPLTDSINGSGYCYVETTNYFPPGVVPPSVSGGQAQSGSTFSVTFDPASLGRMEIYQRTLGQAYNRLSQVKERADYWLSLQSRINDQQLMLQNANDEQKAKEGQLRSLRDQLDVYYSQGRWSDYNALVPEYNRLVQEYNTSLSLWQSLINDYNQMVAEFNTGVKVFYQK